jgi:hypothetical protein
MTDTAYTGVLVSRGLGDVGFTILTDHVWSQGMWGDEKNTWTLQRENYPMTHKREWYHAAAYRADQLQEWLLTVPPFSKRATSICIERVLLHRKDELVTYRVTVTTVSGIHIGLGGTLSDAMADGVMKIWAMMHPTKETG